MHFGTLPWTTWHAVLILDLQDTQWGQTFYFLTPIIFYIFSEHLAIIWKAWEVEKRMENREGLTTLRSPFLKLQMKDLKLIIIKKRQMGWVFVWMRLLADRKPNGFNLKCHQIKTLFSNFSCMFLNYNIFFQFEVWLF